MTGSDWTAEHASLETLRSGLLEVVPMPEHLEMGLSKGLYLVRPDGYIGLTSSNPSELRNYLTQTLGLNA